MRRLIYRYLPILLLVLIGVSVPRSPVMAEDPDWHPFFFDLRLSDYSMSIHAPAYSHTNPLGSWESGFGFHGDYDSGPGFTDLLVHWTQPDILGGDNIRNFTLYTANGSGGTSLAYGNYFDEGGTAYTTGCGTGTDGTGPFLQWCDERSDYLDFYYTTFQGGDHPEMSLFAIAGEYFGLACEADQSCDDEPPALTKPIASEDLHPTWGMYDFALVHSLDDSWTDEDGREPVYAFSNKLGASVHVVAPGTVTAVDNDITSQCTPLDEEGVPLAPHACPVVVPAVIAGQAISQLFTLQMVNTALVLVADDDDPTIIYTYFVTSPSVSVGDHVDAGCVLGSTIPLNNSPLHIGDINLGAVVGNAGASGSVTTGIGLNSIQTGDSVTVVRQDKLVPEVTRLYPSLTAEPDESNCGKGSFGGCINKNSGLLSLDHWTTSDGVSLLDGGGVSIPGGPAQIYQTGIVLDDATNYTLNVQARASSAGDGFTVINKIRLFAGTQISELPITTTWVNYSIDFLGEDLSADQAIGVVNRNAPDVSIEVRYICLSIEGTGQATSSCYFKNHHFDDGPTDWTLSSDVTFDSGQAFTRNDSTVEQGAILDPISDSEDATYNLTVAGRLLATSAYTGQAGKHVTIDYRYPSAGDYTEVGDVDSVLVDSEGRNTFDGSVNIEHPYVLTVPITISDHTNSLFSIRTTVEDEDNYLQGFRIDYICLQSTTDDGSFPGQDDSGGFDPPFYEGCEVVTTPQDNNISSWTYYHWSNLKRFFDCTLMVKLNSMAELMNTMWKTARMFMRWIVATGQLVGRWTQSLMPWLNGQFRNMAIGQVTTVYQTGGGQCSDLFCVLQTLINGLLTPLNNIVNALLGILGGVTGILFTVISGLVTLIVALITQLLGFLQLGQQLLATLITAYNSASPVAIPGLPSCSLDPRSSAFCMGIWVLDNTIFSGTGVVIIPMLTGILSIHLLIWVVAELKRTVISVGQTA